MQFLHYRATAGEIATNTCTGASNAAEYSGAS
jgi:hypothetical protein